MNFSRKLFWLAAVVIVLLGASLRFYAAQGNLWLDEITTLTLVGRMHNPFDAFLMAHDNNHILNSFYLYFIGPGAPTILQRTFSIALGIATIFSAGLTVANRGKGAVLLAMILFALSLPMVNYGSEARGYAGLILCTVLAVHYLDKQLREGGQRWKLALTIFFGLLFHLTMIESVLALGLYTVTSRWHETHAFKKSIAYAAWIFAPAALLMVAFAIDIGAARLCTHKFGYGSIDPFDTTGFFAGYGGMIMATMGMPGRTVSIFGIVIAVAAALLCFLLRKQGDKRLGIYMCFLIALPFAIFICHIPNSHIARYYLASAAAFLLCLVDLVALVWARGTVARTLVAFAILVFAAQTISSLYMFLTYGRDHYAQVVATMTANGPTTYSGTSNDFINLSEVQFYAQRENVVATYVPDADFCRTPSAWLIAATYPWSPLPPARLAWGPETCRLDFARAQVFPVWGLSGLTVTLYGHAN